MRKKILLLSLIALLFLPVFGLTQDCEIEGVEIKWLDTDTSYYEFRAKVWVRNTSRSLYYVRGRLIFYDRDGFQIDSFPFYGKIEAGEGAPLSCRGSIRESESWEVQSYKAIITSQHWLRR